MFGREPGGRDAGSQLTAPQALDIPPELSRFVDPDADGEMEVDAPLSPVEVMVTPVRALAPVVWPVQELFPRDKFLRLASKSVARGLRRTADAVLAPVGSVGTSSTRARR